MNIQALLLISAALTALLTQAVKVWLTEHGKDYSANSLAGCISVAVAICIGIVAAVQGQVTVDAAYICDGAVLAVLSWVSAMVGYDKVVQMLTQLTDRTGG